MALLSTGAARLSTIVYSRAAPYPCYCYYFLLMTQLFVQVKTGWESRFFVRCGARYYPRYCSIRVSVRSLPSSASVSFSWGLKGAQVVAMRMRLKSTPGL